MEPQDAGWAPAPSLLPYRLATTVSSATTFAQLTIRGSAFTVNSFIEFSRLATQGILDTGRRALLSTVSSAHLHHSSKSLRPSDEEEAYATAVAGWTQARFLLLFQARQGKELKCMFQSFARKLNNVISLVEIVTGSTFVISKTVSDVCFGAAEESVRLVDCIFGYNDSSRAIASIIALSSQESSQTRHSSLSGISALVALSKAVVAFALLQGLTHHRNAKPLPAEILCDTVVSRPGQDGRRLVTRHPASSPDALFKSMAKQTRETDLIEVSELAAQHPVKARRDPGILGTALQRLTGWTSPRSEYLEAAEKISGECHPLYSTFPASHPAANLLKYSRYASAAYGHLFLKILDINTRHATSTQHPDIHAFCQHVGCELQDVLLATFADESSFGQAGRHRIVSYLTVDHSARAIVLTCRGSLSLTDLICDLSCGYTILRLPNASGCFYAHSGMLEAARYMLSSHHQVFISTNTALRQHEGYGLILVGHSLGAGVLSLLAMLVSEPVNQFSTFVTVESSGLPAGRRIHVFAYGCPAIASLDLAEYARHLITTVIHRLDLIPFLSLGTLRDWRLMAATLYDEEDLAEDIIRSAFGLQRSSRQDPCHISSGLMSVEERDQHVSDLHWAIFSTLTAQNTSDKLYPAGSVLSIEVREATITEVALDRSLKVQQARRVILRSVGNRGQAFGNGPIFAKSMLVDHSPGRYEVALDTLAAAFAAAC